MYIGSKLKQEISADYLARRGMDGKGHRGYEWGHFEQH